MDGHDARINSAAIPQLDQRRIRLLFHEFLQPIQLPAGKLRRASATVSFRCDRAPFTSSLQEPTNPCRADPVKPGDMRPAAALLVAGLHDPFPQIH
jgi:hypothetical protein